MSGADGGSVRTIVVDLSTGEREAERRLKIALDTLRDQGMQPAVQRVHGVEAVSETMLADAGDGGFPVILGDDRSIRAAVAGVAESALRAEAVEGPEGATGAGAAAGRQVPAGVIGVLAANDRVDFVRTFGIPPDQPAFAADRLVTAPPYPIDAGIVSSVDDSRVERSTWFAGLIEVGFGGAVMRRERRARFRRTAPLTAFWLTELTYRAREVRLAGERREFVARAHNVIVANAQYGRHGIRLSPRSFPGDGSFELLIMAGPKSQQFRMLPRMFQGEHVPDDSITEHRVRSVRIDSARAQPVHADGEYLGTTPVSVRLVPDAVTLRI
jgi:diacylglycerol kinase family enzyme